MAFKVLLLVAAVMGAANAGLISSPAYGYAPIATPTLTSQSSNTLRSFGNQGQISHEAKSIQTPFSSVTRSDVRVTNDAQILAAAPAYAHATYAAPAYAAPAVAHTYAAPAVASYAAPAYAAHTYAAPAVASYAAPAYAAHTYAAPAVASYAAPAAYTKTITTAPAATQLLGVAYSAAPAVAHMTYSNGLGIAYSY